MDTLAEEQRKEEEKNMAREARKKVAAEEKNRKEEEELQKLRKSQLELANSLRNRNHRSMLPLTRTKMMSTSNINASKKADLSRPQPAKQSQAPHSLVKAAATPVAFSKMVPISTAKASETSNVTCQQPVSVVKAAETPLNIAKTVPSAIPHVAPISSDEEEQETNATRIEEVATEEGGGSHEPTSATSVSSSTGFTEIFIGQLPLRILSSSNQIKTDNREMTNYVESKLETVSNAAAAAAQVVPVTTVTIFPVLETNSITDVPETNNNVRLELASNDTHSQINTGEIDNARTAEEDFVSGSSNVISLPVQERNDINAVRETNEESNNKVELDNDDTPEAEVVPGTAAVVATIPVEERNDLNVVSKTNEETNNNVKLNKDDTAETEVVHATAAVVATIPVQETNDINGVGKETNNNVELEKDIAEAAVVPGTAVVVATTIPVQETNNINDSLETTNQVVLPKETTMDQAKECNDNDDGLEVKKKQKPCKTKNNASSAVADNKSQAETKKPQAKQLEESNKFSALYKFMEAESTEKEDMEAECIEEEGMKADCVEEEGTTAESAEEDVETKRAEEAAEKKMERNKRKRQKRKAAATATDETFYDCESDGQSESEFDYIQDIAVPKVVTQETGTRGLRSSLLRVLSLSLPLVCFAGFNYFLSDS